MAAAEPLSDDQDYEGVGEDWSVLVQHQPLCVQQASGCCSYCSSPACLIRVCSFTHRKNMRLQGTPRVNAYFDLSMCRKLVIAGSCIVQLQHLICHSGDIENRSSRMRLQVTPTRCHNIKQRLVIRAAGHDG